MCIVCLPTTPVCTQTMFILIFDYLHVIGDFQIPITVYVAKSQTFSIKRNNGEEDVFVDNNKMIIISIELMAEMVI